MFRGHVNRVALRGRIVGMHESGKTAAEISRELGVTKDTVYLWIRRWQEEGNLTDRRRQGRPRETTNDQDEEIREAAEANPFTNAVAITEDLNLPVSGRTTAAVPVSLPRELSATALVKGFASAASLISSSWSFVVSLGLPCLLLSVKLPSSCHLLIHR
ncbi:hypothetical protein Pmani_019425 [Petrolisthes manimaculis]|uniref:Transposase n=1 Tax=Petrolisthes manimaculis TaxID=1843537 RepID=A0AAE1PAJ4_9EUCA|nr:hypothetical protein Pmani_024343 [Petrolisthes manimaculis]KAK4308900.1 hypothetical protein Pmani_019425 [Petrolisthes manimaculis]